MTLEECFKRYKDDELLIRTSWFEREKLHFSAYYYPEELEKYKLRKARSIKILRELDCYSQIIHHPFFGEILGKDIPNKIKNIFYSAGITQEELNKNDWQSLEIYNLRILKKVSPQ